MTTYIILGVIAGVVIIAIVVISMVERKKNKKIRIERTKLDEEIKISGKMVSEKVMKIVKKNDKNLANFVPSVGKLKMSDINLQAKNELLVIRNSKYYRLIKEKEEEWTDFNNHLENLLSQKSNNWSKRNQADIDFFKNYKIIEPKPEETKKEKKQKKKLAKKVKKDAEKAIEKKQAEKESLKKNEHTK